MSIVKPVGKKTLDGTQDNSYIFKQQNILSIYAITFRNNYNHVDKILTQITDTRGIVLTAGKSSTLA